MNSWEKDQKRDYELQKAIDKAVGMADSIILKASDGSVEETNYLTAMVADRFFKKVLIGFNLALLKKRLGWDKL